MSLLGRAAHTQTLDDALCSTIYSIWADAGLGAGLTMACANRRAVPVRGSWEQKSKGRKRLDFLALCWQGLTPYKEAREREKQKHYFNTEETFLRHSYKINTKLHYFDY